MKDIKEYIYEGLLRGQQSTFDSGEEAIYAVLYTQVKEFLEENYIGKWIISEKPNKDGLYEVSSNESVRFINMKITSLTNDLFIWTSIKGDFGCSHCKELKSLKGAPKEVGGNFSCHHCNSLKTLEGAPEEVGNNFYCYYCNALKTLEGAPKIVKGSFDSSHCQSMESLKGAPEEVGGVFSCSFCDSLKSLEGAPKYIRGSFNCYDFKSLESLDGCPKTVGKNFAFYRNKIKISKLKIKMKCQIKGSIFC